MVDTAAVRVAAQHAPAVRTSATTPLRIRNSADTFPGVGQHREAQEGRQLQASREGGGEGSREQHCGGGTAVAVGVYTTSLARSWTHEKHIASFDCTHWLTLSLESRTIKEATDYCCYKSYIRLWYAPSPNKNRLQAPSRLLPRLSRGPNPTGSGRTHTQSHGGGGANWPGMLQGEVAPSPRSNNNNNSIERGSKFHFFFKEKAVRNRQRASLRNFCCVCDRQEQ